MLKFAGRSIGQTFEHSPHPVHLSSRTKRGWRFTVRVKLPGSPSSFSTVVFVRISMLRWLASSTSLGPIMQEEQSLVGNVLSSWDMTPPTLGCSSIRYTLN